MIEKRANEGGTYEQDRDALSMKDGKSESPRRNRGEGARRVCLDPQQRCLCLVMVFSRKKWVD